MPTDIGSQSAPECPACWHQADKAQRTFSEIDNTNKYVRKHYPASCRHPRRALLLCGRTPIWSKSGVSVAISPSAIDEIARWSRKSLGFVRATAVLPYRSPAMTNAASKDTAIRRYR